MEQQQIFNESVNSFEKGLHITTTTLLQPKGTYPYGLNLVADEAGEKHNERGFTAFACLQADEIQLGQIAINNGRFVVFAKNTTSTIYLVDQRNKTTTIVLQDSDLGFNDNPITAIYKLNYKGEVIIQFVQQGNPPRIINIDEVLAEGLSSIDNLSVFSTQLSVPNPVITEVTELGSLRSGVYELSFAYEDASGNLGDFLASTLPISITEDSYSSGYKAFDGCEANTPTSKAVTVSISNLDRDYKYLVIAGTSTINGIVTSYIIAKQPITSDSIEYTYTGSEATSTLDTEQILVNRQYYISAGTITQKNKRAILGDLEGVNEEELQSYINQIRVGTIFKTIDYEGMDNFKGELHTANSKGFLFDEVYALAAVIGWTNGTESAPIHIPGRNANTTPFSKTILSDERQFVASNDPNNVLGRTAQLWEVYNTSDSGIGSSSVTDTLADNAFWESTLNYPAGKGYPSEFGDGNTPIRHHRVSDYATPYVVNGSTKRQVIAGFRIGTLKLPASLRKNIQYIKIVRGVRDTANKSIIAKGIWTPLIASFETENAAGDEVWSNILGFSNPVYYDGGSSSIRNALNLYGGTNPYVNMEVGSFFSPDTFFNKVGVKVGDYIKYKAKLTGAAAKHSDNKWLCGFNNAPTIKNGTNIRQKKLRGLSYVDNNNIFTIPTLNSTYSNIYNNKGGQHTLVLNSVGQIVLPSDLDSLHTQTSAYDTEAQAHYCYIKRYVPSQYGTLDSIKYVDTGFIKYIKETDFDNTDTYIPSLGDADGMDVFGGDAFTSWFSFRKTTGDTPVDGTYIYVPCIDSTVNSNYRFESGGDLYYPKSNMADVVNQSINTSNPSGYNKDYSSEPKIRVHFPDSDDNEPATKFRTRAIYSEQDLGETTKEAYRIFKASNYIDLPSHTGPITNLFVAGETLMAHTPNGLWDLRDSPRQIKTNSENLFIGSGQLFSNEPVNKKERFFGCMSKAGWCNTSIGVVYVSAIDKKVYLVSQEPIDITPEVSNFFEKHGDFEFIKDCNKIGVTVTEDFDNPTSPYSIGYLCYFDKDLNRVIITKRDFKVKAALTTKFVGIFDEDVIYNNGDIYYKDGYFIIYNDSVTTLPLLLTNSTYFDDCSFSISYSFKHKQWVALHSYKPTNALTTELGLVLRENGLLDGNQYEVGNGNFGKFIGGVIYPSAIETIHNDGAKEDKFFAFIETDVKATIESDAGDKDSPTSFFDKVWVYNSYQGSNEITLTRNSNVFKVLSKWRFNEFYNKLTSNKIIFKPVGVDKAFESSSFVTNKWYEESRFIDKYLVVRFILNNLKNEKFSVYLTTAYFQKAIR